MTTKNQLSAAPVASNSPALTSAYSGSLGLFVSSRLNGNILTRPGFTINNDLLMNHRDIYSATSVRCPALSPSKKAIAYIIDSKIQIWNLGNLTLENQFSIQKNLVETNSVWDIRDLAWIGESHIALAWETGFVQVYTREGVICISDKIGGYVHTLAVSTDLNYFATTTFPGKENRTESSCVMLYDCAAIIEQGILRPVRRINGFSDFYALPVTMLFYPDQESIIGASGRNNEDKTISMRVEVFNLLSGKTKVLMEETGGSFPPSISNIADNGRYCITTPKFVQVYDASHRLIWSIAYDATKRTYPPVKIARSLLRRAMKP